MKNNWRSPNHPSDMPAAEAVTTMSRDPASGKGFSGLEFKNTEISENERNVFPANIPFGNACPTAKFRISGSKMGEEIVFTDESTDPDGEIAAYLWDFGDGLPETTANPSHVYEKEGDYTVTLIVWDDFGRAARYAETLHVGAGSETTHGDINGDGAINAKDVTILRRYIAGSSISAEKIAVGDINGDGAVDAKDVTVLRRYIAKNPA